LDEKYSSDLFVPSTLEDLQALLDNEAVMCETPVLGEISADNYYLNYTFWQPLNTQEKNAYIWAEDIYDGVGNMGDWNYPYQQVFYANVVLDGIDKVAVTNNNGQQWNSIKGAALFIRAYAFYNVSQVFAPVYDNSTANQPDLGIPLRLTANIDAPSSRSTLGQTYAQIISDLQQARILLPDSIQTNLTHPSKPAALALLARVYLSMRLYDKAWAYADTCLQFYNKLIDYNQVNASLNRPFEKTNAETMYQSRLSSSTSVFRGQVIRDCIIDSGLYQSYATNDLRRTVFYTTTIPANFKGSYTGSNLQFSGLATDEVYLIRAECNARLGRRSEAMQDLNHLLQNRWETGTFIPYAASTDDEALQKILTERRKELPCRGVRWTDLRRLNKEGAGITLKRMLKIGQTDSIYTLQPNSALYTLPIPPDVIALSGIKQNDRTRP
jgi:tetratricopeptide (TPR) repeat protein